MSVNYCPILSTLGYILSPDGQSVLLSHRIGRKSDEQFGKYNGLGGHMEAEEDAAACMLRELREEAEIEVTAMTLRGTVNWTGFGPNHESWLAFIFLITAFKGTPPPRNVEGDLVWVPRARLFDYPMWEGDRYFLPLVFDDDPRPFHGYLPYDGEHPLKWSFTRL